MTSQAPAAKDTRSIRTTTSLMTHNDRDDDVLAPEKLNNPGHLIDDAAGPSPSFFLLFSLLTRRQTLFLLVPAIVLSMAAGGIAPFMTFVVGQAFDVFSEYSSIQHPSQDDKGRLIHGIAISVIELVALAAGALVLGSITSGLWIWTGEWHVKALRKRVYTAVTRKDMVWFDMKMGTEGAKSGDDGPIGPGGMMSKFSRETDDVQQASMAFGMAVQHLTTCFTCLILAFTRSWLLTLVILSAVPALVILQGLSQGLAAPLLARELATNAVAGTIVERGVSSIATVKAFNAAAYEYASLRRVLDHLFIVDRRLNAVWGFTTGLGQFVMMAMFVQGFWFGAKLVREGSARPGDVMAVFWACLIATSNMQMCIPHFIILAKGKVSMASLLALIGSSSGPAKFAKRPRGFYRNNPQSLRKIIPRDCLGELAMQTVSFTYPTRPTLPVLQDVTIFLPANEMTFIVGGSGSGKSTIAQLLCRIYQPQAGIVQLDNQDLAYLDEAWLREQVACVSQDCILFDMSVHDNIAMGLTGDRIPADATRAEVVEACQAALMHEFIRELPEGYDTMLGTGGANLSGGQRQRLAIARALLRDPTVLILDESTSALDATSRLLVFEAIKRWRHKKTTVVITHDLSQITPQDFVYVLQGGRVAEQGYRYDLERTQSGEFRAMMLTQRATGGFLPVKDIERNIDFAAVQRDHAFSDSEDGVPLNAATLSRRSMRNLHTFSIVAGRSSSSRRIRRVPRVGDLAQEFGQEDDLPLTKTGMQASRRRQSVQGTHRRHRLAQIEGESDFVKVERPQTFIKVSSEVPQSFWSLIRDIYPSVPAKGFVLFGVVVCVLSGAITPLFSYLLSGLLYQVSIGAHDAAAINVLGAIVLGVAAGDGFLMGFKYFLMETAAMKWVNFTRELCYNLILTQDKKWFDKSQNSPVRMVQILIKDGDDARVLMAEVLGQCVVVVAMSVAGLTWALVRGWELTLVGVAIAPIFAGALAIQSTWAARFEHRSKRAKEFVSKSYYEAVLNVRGIRSMGFEKAFRTQFDNSTDHALSAGVKGAFVTGASYGLASGLIYLAEGLLFYVGAILLARGRYSYIQMVEVLNLIVFTVTIGSQLMAFTEKIAKSVQAASDFNRLLKLAPDSEESRGLLQPTIKGPIIFDQVSFAYPERPEVNVLNQLSMKIDDGECVALVGSSGSGKSTVAALLQRLYEPNSGRILIGSSGKRPLAQINVNYLRKHVAVVSQNPNLFHATIAENIAYGRGKMSLDEIKQAAMAANVHDFIMGLPLQYDTTIGENASLISGGQAQRLQIARALARPSRFLILDECTSSLDAANEAAVMDTIRRAKVGRTTIMITHKLKVMRLCDRILVMHGGELKEHGSYQTLMANNGVFAQLARSGEWVR